MIKCWATECLNNNYRNVLGCMKIMLKLMGATHHYINIISGQLLSRHNEYKCEMFTVPSTVNDGLEMAGLFSAIVKGSVFQNFRPIFLGSKPIGDPDKKAKIFSKSIWPRYCNFKKLRGVHHTVKSDSAVCILPWSRTPQYAFYYGVGLHSMHSTMESDSAVCIPSWRRTPRSASVLIYRICWVRI